MNLKMKNLLVAIPVVLALLCGGVGCDDKDKSRNGSSTNENDSKPQGRGGYGGKATHSPEKQYKLTFFAKSEDVSIFGTFKGGVFIRRDGIIEKTLEFSEKSMYETSYDYNASSVGHLQIDFQITLEHGGSKNSLCRITDNRNQARVEQKTMGMRNVTCQYSVK